MASKIFHGICDEAYANISRADLEALLLVGRKAVANATWVTNAQLLGEAALDCNVPLPDATICFICHQGWADESSGPLHPCGGKCRRAFHTGCYPDFLPTLVCGLCNGTDTVVCCVCDHEWSDPCKESDFYTGLLVECEGGCNRHFHQKCHVVPIPDAATLSSAPPFHCDDCKAVRSRPDSSTQPPSSPRPTTTPDVAGLTASVEDAPMGDAPTEEEAEGEPAEPMESDIPSAAISLTLTRGTNGKLGLHVLKDTNVVESVGRGGAAEKAGVQPGDHVVGVGGRYLSQFVRFDELLPIGQLGSTLTLSVLRAPPAPGPATAATGASSRSVRKRTPTAPAAAMSSLEGVRLSDGHSGKRVARQVRAFPVNSADHL